MQPNKVSPLTMFSQPLQYLVPMVVRDQLLHNIGNLTLLTEKLNPSLSNRSFADERREITKSLLALNAYVQDQRWIVPDAAWNETTIRERAVALLKVAVNDWPLAAL